jgi:hypothetical protein
MLGLNQNQFRGREKSSGECTTQLIAILISRACLPHIISDAQRNDAPAIRLFYDHRHDDRRVTLIFYFHKA